jgi:transcriptional regulator with XRE-family HTH domain
MKTVRYTNRLREIRELAGLTMSKAARSMAITPSTLHRHETGTRDLDAYAIERYARFYGVKAHEIFVPADFELEYVVDEG